MQQLHGPVAGRILGYRLLVAVRCSVLSIKISILLLPSIQSYQQLYCTCVTQSVNVWQALTRNDSQMQAASTVAGLKCSTLTAGRPPPGACCPKYRRHAPYKAFICDPLFRGPECWCRFCCLWRFHALHVMTSVRVQERPVAHTHPVELASHPRRDVL